jgi:hypothetical protein
MGGQANLSSLYDLIGKIGAANVRGVKMHPDSCKHLRGAGAYPTSSRRRYALERRQGYFHVSG